MLNDEVVTDGARDAQSPALRDAKGRFAAGQTGNPGGRPRGMAAEARAALGKDGRRGVRWLREIAEGRIEGASVRDRILAIRELFDRGHGKPIQAIAADVRGDVPPFHLVTFGGRYKEDGSLEKWTGEAMVPEEGSTLRPLIIDMVTDEDVRAARDRAREDDGRHLTPSSRPALQAVPTAPVRVWEPIG